MKTLRIFCFFCTINNFEAVLGHHLMPIVNLYIWVFIRIHSFKKINNSLNKGLVFISNDHKEPSKVVLHWIFVWFLLLFFSFF